MNGPLVGKLEHPKTWAMSHVRPIGEPEKCRKVVGIKAIVEACVWTLWFKCIRGKGRKGNGLDWPRLVAFIMNNRPSTSDKRGFSPKWLIGDLNQNLQIEDVKAWQFYRWRYSEAVCSSDYLCARTECWFDIGELVNWWNGEKRIYLRVRRRLKMSSNWLRGEL